MTKHLKGVVIAIALLGVFDIPVLSAQVSDTSRSSAHNGGRIVHERLTTNTGRSGLSMPGLDTWHLSASDQAAPQPAAKKKEGRKAMWILLGASAAIITATVMFAPGEAPIPATPSSNWRCTSFYRPGTLMTTSGYTCVSR